MKSGQDSKLRQTIRTTMRVVKLTQSMRKTKGPSMRETNINNYGRSRAAAVREKEREKEK